MRSSIARSIVLAVLAMALAVPISAQGVSSSAPLIVIDPGHGGPYSNANSNGLREKTVNLQIALELRRQLLARGYRVAMTRTTDRAITLADIPTWNWISSSGMWSYRRDGHTRNYGGIPRDDLQARADIANRLGADLFISIHNNGSASRAARGTETIASRKDPLGIQLSRLVHRRVVARTGLRDRGAKQMDLYVCRWTNAPAILVEGAFITNPSDAYKLKQYRFRRRIAVGIAEGVHSWFATRPYRPVLARTTATSAQAAALMASTSHFPTGAPTAVIARSDQWADVPGAPALAARLNGPMLWMDASGPTTQTAQEIARLAPARLIALGLEGSIDATAVTRLREALPASSTVETVAAETRADLSAKMAGLMGASETGEVVIADSSDTAGLLTVAAAAAQNRLPLLLAENGTLGVAGAQALADLAPTRIVALGPETAVPSSVAGGLPIVRLSGADAASRASAINAHYYRTTTASALRPVIADIRYGAEYLSAADFAGRLGQPLLPVDGRVVPTLTRHWITNRRPQIAAFHVFDAKMSIPTLTDHALIKADRP